MRDSQEFSTKSLIKLLFNFQHFFYRARQSDAFSDNHDISQCLKITVEPLILQHHETTLDFCY